MTLNATKRGEKTKNTNFGSLSLSLSPRQEIDVYIVIPEFSPLSRPRKAVNRALVTPILHSCKATLVQQYFSLENEKIKQLKT